MKPVFLHWQEGRRDVSEPSVSIGEIHMPSFWQPPQAESSSILWEVPSSAKRRSIVLCCCFVLILGSWDKNSVYDK